MIALRYSQPTLWHEQPMILEDEEKKLEVCEWIGVSTLQTQMVWQSSSNPIFDGHHSFDWLSHPEISQKPLKSETHGGFVKISTQHFSPQPQKTKVFA